MTHPRPSWLRRLTSAIARRHPADDDGGWVSLFVVMLSVPIAFLGIGLVVDGGGQIRATEQADDIAQQAGRAAAQTVSVDSITTATGARINSALAVNAANTYLTASGITGTVTVTGPTTLTIATNVNYTSHFLHAGGVYTAHGHANITLISH